MPKTNLLASRLAKVVKFSAQPTERSLICHENNERHEKGHSPAVVFFVVVLIPDWYIPVWEHCFETHWEAFSADQLLENKAGRGDNALLIVNHFLTRPLDQEAASRSVNRTGFLEQRFGLGNTLDRRPNFIVVDFYETGDRENLTGLTETDSK